MNNDTITKIMFLKNLALLINNADPTNQLFLPNNLSIKAFLRTYSSNKAQILLFLFGIFIFFY